MEDRRCSRGSAAVPHHARGIAAFTSFHRALEARQRPGVAPEGLQTSTQLVPAGTHSLRIDTSERIAHLGFADGPLEAGQGALRYTAVERRERRDGDTEAHPNADRVDGVHWRDCNGSTDSHIGRHALRRIDPVAVATLGEGANHTLTAASRGRRTWR